MTGRMITGEVVENGEAMITEVDKVKGMDYNATEMIIKANVRWRNNDEKDYGGYRGSSSRRKPWDGDLDY